MRGVECREAPPNQTPTMYCRLACTSGMGERWKGVVCGLGGSDGWCRSCMEYVVVVVVEMWKKELTRNNG
jgi:hypothetical protein